MKATTKKKQPTQTELGRRYGVTERTIRTWEREGAPLGNPRAMYAWIDDRRANNGAQGSRPPELPEGMEHSNLLRLMMEEGAAHFLWYAFTTCHDRYIEGEVGRGRTSQQAEADFLHFYFVMGCALKWWTEGDAFNAHNKNVGTPSLDDAMKALVPNWREKSLPPLKFTAKPVPEAIRKYAPALPELWDFTVG